MASEGGTADLSAFYALLDFYTPVSRLPARASNTARMKIATYTAASLLHFGPDIVRDREPLVTRTRQPSRAAMATSYQSAPKAKSCIRVSARGDIDGA